MEEVFWVRTILSDETVDWKYTFSEKFFRVLFGGREVLVNPGLKTLLKSRWFSKFFRVLFGGTLKNTLFRRNFLI